jgi:hypothetical protein
MFLKGFHKRIARGMGVGMLVSILAVACNAEQLGQVNSALNQAGTLSAQMTAPAPPSSGGGAASSGNHHYGVQTKTSGCVAQNGLADPDCTPGAIIDGVTAAQVCVSGYSGGVRNVPQSEKDQVYAEYGIASHTSGEYEVDHYISLELGGSNDISNLFPEAAQPTPGFHEKDKVENYLHAQVCSGAMTLAQAQDQISTNWLAVYDKMPK